MFTSILQILLQRAPKIEKVSSGYSMIEEQRRIMASGLRHFCKGSNYVEVNIEVNKIIVLQWKEVLMNL